MEKMKFETEDLSQKNIDKIEQLFPNCITETRDENGKLKKAINFKMLKQMLSEDVVDDGDEAYEFTWVGKKEAMVEANKPIRKTLRPCKEESKDWDTTENLYIEGDNLEVLKLLQESYLNSIKMIYIDPPYNTGNDFIYNDDFKMARNDYQDETGEIDEEGNRLVKNTDTNGRFHSDWCSMMYSRLMLARNLLTEDGAIIINMDENEISNLQKICQEIFGESNEIGVIVWDKRNPKGDAKGVSYQHEYIVIYSKNKNKFVETCDLKRPKANAMAILNKAEQLYRKINDHYTLDDVNIEFSRWIRSQDDFSGGEKAYCKIDKDGNVYRAVHMGWPNKKKAPDEYYIPLLHPKTGKPCPVPERGWRNPPSTMKELYEKGEIIFGEDESIQPSRKYLLKDNMTENVPSILYYGGSDTKLLKELNIPFETPKVVDVCSNHVSIFTRENDIILDFFAGSSTTAHGVMELNAKDAGKRKFIMVQIPEECDEKSKAYKFGYNNICELGKERIRRAGEKIKKDCTSKAGIENLDIGFRVFKIDDTNMKDVYYTTEQYSQTALADLESNIKEDRTDLDLLYGCLIEWGVPLNLPYESKKLDESIIHIYNGNDLIACFDNDITENVIKEIAQMKPLRAVFRDSGFRYSAEKINVEEIFKLISPETSVRII